MLAENGTPSTAHPRPQHPAVSAVGPNGRDRAPDSRCGLALQAAQARTCRSL